MAKCSHVYVPYMLINLFFSVNLPFVSVIYGAPAREPNRSRGKIFFFPPYSIYKNFDCIFGQPTVVGDASLILYKQ